MPGTAHSLRNPAATRTGHIMDVSYIRRDDERMWVVLRQCDFDDVRTMTIAEARADYAKRLRTMGFVPTAEPVYGVVRLDRFSRVSCYRDDAHADKCEAAEQARKDRLARIDAEYAERMAACE
jgi:hypothetical protein